jgi:hypothetical protein
MRGNYRPSRSQIVYTESSKRIQRQRNSMLDELQKALQRVFRQCWQGVRSENAGVQKVDKGRSQSLLGRGWHRRKT